MFYVKLLILHKIKRCVRLSGKLCQMQTNPWQQDGKEEGNFDWYLQVWLLTHLEGSVMSLKLEDRPGVVAHTCNPSTLEGWGGWITWGREFKTSLANIVNPCLYYKYKNYPGMVAGACNPSYSGRWGEKTGLSLRGQGCGEPWLYH